MNYWVILAVLCAYIIKGMCGFANTLVFSTMLSFGTNNIAITPLELLVGYPSNLIIAYRERKAITIRVWIPLAGLVVAGSIPGTFLLKNGDTTVIKILFGAVVTFIAAEMFFREIKKERRKSSPLLLGGIGILSGLLCGLFGIGALLAAYVSRTTDNNSAFRGNLCLVFIIENTFRLITYSLTGILTIEILRNALMLLPFMLAGLIAGMKLARVVSEQRIKKLVILMLALSGISLVVDNILRLIRGW